MRRILISAGMVLVAVFAAFAAESVSDDALFRLLVVIALLGIGMGLAITRRADKRVSMLCDPLVLMLLFLGQFYIIGPIALHIWGHPDLKFFRPLTEGRQFEALAGFAVMLTTCVIGYHLPVGGIVATRLPEFASTRRLPGRWIETVFVVAGMSGCVGWLVFQGGLMATIGVGYGAGRGGGAVFAVTHVLMLIGTMLMAWRFIATRSRRILDRAILGGVILWVAVFFGVLYGSRKYLLYLFFGLLTIWLLHRGKEALPKLAVSAVLAVLLVFFSVWGSVRGRPVAALVGSGSDLKYAETQALHLGYVNSVAAPFAVACLVYDVFPHQESFKNGSTLLVTLLAFVPRAVWPDKPIGIGKELTRYLVGPYYEEYEGFSVAPTVVADFYLNFGWIGVICGGLILGIVCRAVTGYATLGMRDARQSRAARVLIPAVFVMMLGEVRGDMSTILLFYGLGFGPLIVALRFFSFDDGVVAERREAYVSPGAALPDRAV